MKYQIESLELPGSLSAYYNVSAQNAEGGRRKLVDRLSHINIFVGPNNSGKSRLLRGIIAAEKLRFTPKGYSPNIAKAVKQIREDLSGIGGSNASVEPFETQVQQMPDYELVQEGEPVAEKLVDMISRAKQADAGGLHVTFRGVSPPSNQELVRKLRKVGEDADKLLAGAIEKLPPKYDFQRIYLPTLRGLRTIGGGTKDVYKERTENDYFKGRQAKVEIFTGLGFYEEVRDLLLGERKQRRLVQEFEHFLSQSLFDGQVVTLMPRKDKDVVYVRIGRETELPVYELGDGVQHLIILMFPLFKHQETPSLVFIEEPELYLHPGMQRLLVKAMMHFSNHQYFISTHSNHLLDLTIEVEDISIYMVRKEVSAEHEEDAPAKFEIEAASTHDARVLKDLGTRVSSVFLTNCTVWVEGVTDRRYLAHFLELYGDWLTTQEKEKAKSGEGRLGKVFIPRQDFHFSFVEYSGGNITHWSFLDRTDDPIEVKRLCARLMLVADKDGAKWKEERQAELKARLGDNFVCLDCREVENLLTAEVLKNVLIEYGEAEADIQPLAAAKYQNEPLGKYLHSRLLKITRRGGYAEASQSKPGQVKLGTIKNKTDFCAKAIKQMTKYTDLSDDARKLTERVYEFIKQHN